MHKSSLLALVFVLTGVIPSALYAQNTEASAVDAILNEVSTFGDNAALKKNLMMACQVFSDGLMAAGMDTCSVFMSAIPTSAATHKHKAFFGDMECVNKYLSKADIDDMKARGADIAAVDYYSNVILVGLASDLIAKADPPLKTATKAKLENYVTNLELDIRIGKKVSYPVSVRSYTLDKKPDVKANITETSAVIGTSPPPAFTSVTKEHKTFKEFMKEQAGTIKNINEVTPEYFAKLVEPNSFLPIEVHVDGSVKLPVFLAYVKKLAKAVPGKFYLLVATKKGAPGVPWESNLIYYFPGEEVASITFTDDTAKSVAAADRSWRAVSKLLAGEMNLLSVEIGTSEIKATVNKKKIFSTEMKGTFWEAMQDFVDGTDVFDSIVIHGHDAMTMDTFVELMDTLVDKEALPEDYEMLLSSKPVITDAPVDPAE